MRSALYRGTTASFALAIATIAGPAFGQATAPASSPEAVEATAQPDSDIIVTGSRIARPDLEQASPIAVVSGEEFALQGTTNVENVLNDLPQVVGSSTGTSNNPGGGVATVDLRGLGAQRTLVLVDGRRYMSYDTSQVVDLNTIPAALIDRVDIVTGGRSAVYGSDAVAGVVNFITKRNFSGVEIGSTYELSSRGDGARADIYATVGGNFDEGRGNATVSVDYYKRKPIFAGARSFSTFALQDSRNGTAFNGGSGSVSQGRINPGGTVGNVDFDQSGGISPYVAATDAYNYAPVNYLQVPQERYAISAQARYEISDAFQPYVEAQFVNNVVDNQLAATPISNATPIGTGAAARGLGSINLLVRSPFFSAATQTAFAARDAAETGAAANDGYITVPNYGFRTVGIGPRVNRDDRNAYRFVVGLKGNITNDWSYDAYYMRSRTKNAQQQTGNVALDKFLNSVTTVFRNTTTGATSTVPAAGFTLQCASAAAVAAGCVPSNLFGEGNLSAASAAYLGIAATNLEEYTSQVASFALTNSSLFDFGAGGVGIALGAEYRKEEGSVTPDTNLASGNVAGFNPGAPTSGSYSVREFFGEVNVPLLRDAGFINLVELNGAARHTHYSNAPGNVFSWSAGGLAKVASLIAFRGQYQRAIRGPSVNELFLGQTVSFDGVEDPCGTDAAASGTLRARCLATGVPATTLDNAALRNSLNDSSQVNPPTFLGGNANLREEKSTTYTFGGILTPSFLPGFSATVDYYNIKIDGYIARLGQSNLAQACYVANIDQFCQFQRNAVGQVETIRDVVQNSGGLKTSGIDVSAGYNWKLGSMFGADDAKLAFSFAGTRLLNYDYTPVQGIAIVNDCEGKFGNSCGQPLPKWKHSVRTTLSVGPTYLSGQWRYFGSVRDDNPAVQFFLERAKAQNYFDFTVGTEVGSVMTFNVGVSNAFDKKPPLSASSQQNGNGEQSNTYPSAYDVLGRYFFVSAKARF